MKCTKAQELFSGYLENALELPLRVAFEQHLAQCLECKARYEGFNATVVMLDEVPEIDPSPCFHAAVMARVESARRIAPHRIKWWWVDWERVFTVRVPARAVAMGFAVLLLLALAIQLTPLNSITSGLPWVRHTVQQSAVVDESAPRPSDPSWESNSGKQALQYIGTPTISVNVTADSTGETRTVFALHLSTKSKVPIRVQVDLLPNSLAGDDSAASRYYTGSVEPGRKLVVPIPVMRSEHLAARVSWACSAGFYSEFVFMPSNFDLKAASKNLTLSFRNESVYDILSDISDSYGIVVLASGDLARKIPFVEVESGRPDEALYNCVLRTGLKWRAVATSVYAIGPAE